MVWILSYTNSTPPYPHPSLPHSSLSPLSPSPPHPFPPHPPTLTPLSPPQPENLLLASRTPGANVKLADFGLAVEAMDARHYYGGWVGVWYL